MVMLLTGLLSCLEEGAAHSRTHTRTHTWALMKTFLYVSTNTFIRTTQTNFILSIHFTARTHERALTHLNACTCLPAPTHSVNDSIFLSYFVFLSHSLYWKATLIGPLIRRDTPSQLIPGGVLQREHFQWLQCIKAFTFCF